MPQVLPFILFGTGFIVLFVWITQKARASKSALASRMELLGFRACPEESEAVLARVTQLENNAEYRYEIDNLMRAELDGKALFYYTKTLRRHDETAATEDVLVPLKRPSNAGLLLFVKPNSVPAGAMSKLIGNVATGPWDRQPDDLVRLTLPRDLQSSNIIGALGPHDGSLYDLMDPKKLPLIQQLGDCGVLMVLCRGGWCSLIIPHSHIPLNIDKLGPIIQQLM